MTDGCKWIFCCRAKHWLQWNADDAVSCVAFEWKIGLSPRFRLFLPRHHGYADFDLRLKIFFWKN